MTLQAHCKHQPFYDHSWESFRILSNIRVFFSVLFAVISPPAETRSSVVAVHFQADSVSKNVLSHIWFPAGGAKLRVETALKWFYSWRGPTDRSPPTQRSLCGAAGIRLQTGFNPKDMSLETAPTLWSRLKYLNMTAVYEEHEYD